MEESQVLFVSFSKNAVNETAMAFLLKTKITSIVSVSAVFLLGSFFGGGGGGQTYCYAVFSIALDQNSMRGVFQGKANLNF